MDYLCGHNIINHDAKYLFGQESCKWALVDTLYMSPLLFFGMKQKLPQIQHNVYKSDVFSLGLCILLAGCLNYGSLVAIRELTDMNQITNVVMYYLSGRYSPNIISFIIKMLEIDENIRPDFIQLESMLVKKNN